jgi:broad specificity phosphatase PhoE
MTPFLYLARHGQTPINARNGLQGHIDMPLNENGLGHAAALGAYFRDKTLAGIWASPLQRAQKTAAPVAKQHGLPLQTDPDLIEVDYGDIDGLGMDEAPLVSNYGERDNDRMGYRPPNGETYWEVLARLRRFFAKDLGEPALVVAHHGILRMACAHFELMTPAEAAMQNFGHQSIITIYRDTNNKINGHIEELSEHERV